VTENSLRLRETLLAYLRDSLNLPSLDYAEAPVALVGGYETSIFAFRLADGPWQPTGLILRIFRSHEDPRRALYEAAIHNVVGDLGYPAPRVHLSCTDGDILGGGFLVMQRMPGRPLLQDLFRLSTVLGLRTRMFGFVSRLLAELQLRLHALPPTAILDALKAAGVPEKADAGRISLRSATEEGQFQNLAWRIDHAELDGLRPGLEWLLTNRPMGGERVICHGDFHPLNLLVNRGQVTGVIDWQLAAVAHPEFDVGTTRMLMTLAPANATGSIASVVSALRKSTARRYIEAYRKERSLDPRSVEYYEAYRCLRSLTWAGETRQAALGVIEDRGPNPWHPVHVVKALTARFAEITGATLRLPPIA
jgi:aminoglycoside phosphotransferase (APT) family kinase protein